MIIGSGSIAKMINDREGALLFAAGVSNSQFNNKDEFDREWLAVHRAILSNPDLCFFYFSTISINFLDTPYTRHKIDIETLIKHTANNYNIIRIGNIWECTNPNTFRNYMMANPDTPIRDEYKYMISKEQLTLITDNLPLTGKNEISIFGEMKKVKDCL